MNDVHVVLKPDSLFVVACPVCLGQVAATGSLCGHDACCPLCASLFHVPFPVAAERQAPPSVAEQPRPEAAGLAEDWGRVIRQLAPPPHDPEPEPEVPAPTEFELPQAVADALLTVDQAAGGSSVAPAADDLPVVSGTPLDPAVQELVFSEPVRTVRQGDTVIEIRRLTPEERRARRFRRNLLMVVVGVSILLAIGVVFGVPKKP